MFIEVYKSHKMRKLKVGKYMSVDIFDMKLNKADEFFNNLKEDNQLQLKDICFGFIPKTYMYQNDKYTIVFELRLGASGGSTFVAANFVATYNFLTIIELSDKSNSPKYLLDKDT